MKVSRQSNGELKMFWMGYGERFFLSWEVYQFSVSGWMNLSLGAVWKKPYVRYPGLKIRFACSFSAILNKGFESLFILF
jgi:hypothetical protein